MKDFRYYLPTPFHCDDSNLYADNGEIIGSYYGLDMSFLKTATSIINGSKEYLTATFRYDKENKVVRFKDKPMIYIKGSVSLAINWGLEESEIERIQHEIGEYITNQLNK